MAAKASGRSRSLKRSRRFSAVIMTAPARADLLPELDKALGEKLTRVSDDGGLGVWGNGRRALLSYDARKSHHLVLQDDVIPCRDLLAGIDEILRFVPEDNLVSLYLGAPRPPNAENRYMQLAREADEKRASWVILDHVTWGPALVVPTKHIDAIVKFGDGVGPHTTSYDGRIGQWCAKNKISAWHTWPSLVAHRQDTPSLIGKKMGRDCIRFAGLKTSAVRDLSWDGPIIDKDNGVTRGWRKPYGKERAVEQTEEKATKVKRDKDAAWAIGDDRAIARIESGVEYDLNTDGSVGRFRSESYEHGTLIGACTSADEEPLEGQVVVGKRMALRLASARIVYSGPVAAVDSVGEKNNGPSNRPAADVAPEESNAGLPES